MKASLEELTGLAFEAFPHAVLIVDGSGMIIARNAAGRSMLPDGADIAAAIKGGADPPDVDWRAELACVAEGEGELARRNVWLHHMNGKRLLADIYLRRLPLDAKGDAVLVMVEDVSSRVTMERRQAATDRLAALGELAANVAHELNNPLDGVLRYIGLAERAAGRKAAEYLAKARVGLVRMAEVVGRLLGRTGGGPGRGEASGVEKLLEEAAITMQPRAEMLGVAMVSDIEQSASVPVAGSLFQVFCNVIKNALDAMPDGGRLTMRMRRADDQCVVTFADTGCGLKAEEAERIFQPFYTTKPPGEASGLGLAICREILAGVGGSISIAPRPTGGALVTVRLPLHKRWPADSGKDQA